MTRLRKAHRWKEAATDACSLDSRFVLFRLVTAGEKNLGA